MGRTTAKKETQTHEEYLNASVQKVETVAGIEPQLNLEQQVTVRSIAGWTTGFARMITVGDVSIPKKGAVRLSRNEIISQVHNNNTLFTGVDGKGNHATLIIDDYPTIKEVGFEDAQQFSDELVKKLFSYAQNQFEDEIRKAIVTRAEKYALMISICKQKDLNDFSKIRFCEKYTGYKMDKVEQDEKNVH